MSLTGYLKPSTVSNVYFMSIVIHNPHIPWGSELHPRLYTFLSTVLYLSIRVGLILSRAAHTQAFILVCAFQKCQIVLSMKRHLGPGVRLLWWFPLMGENHGEDIKKLVVSLIKWKIFGLCTYICIYIYTLPETNIAPESGFFGRWCSFSEGLFTGAMFVLGRVYIHFPLCSLLPSAS